MLRKRYGRRGLSTIVTSLMLIVAVSMIGVALVSWSNFGFAIKQREIADQTNGRINLVKETFIIEDVWFYSNGVDSYANVTIRNTGDNGLTISNIYVNTTEVWNEGEDILKDEVAIINFQTDWESGNSQSIWVRTERGSDMKQVWKS